MAERYLSTITSVQAHGPYLLGGWSLGGIVAFEMARQLRGRGEEVAFLGLIDTVLPDRSQEPDDLEILRWLLESSEVPVSMPVLRAIPPERRLAILRERLVSANLAPPDLSLRDIERIFGLFRANVLAAHRYAPEPLDAPITLFCATDESANAERRDPRTQWSALARRSMTVHAVPGTHAKIVREPNVRALAAALGNCLDEAG